MASVIGSQLVVIPAGINPAAVNITVPAGTQRVLAFWGWYNGGNGVGLASATCDAQAPVSGGNFEVASVSTGNGQPAGGVVAFDGIAPGTRALDFAWDQAPGDGPTCLVVYLADVASAAWVDADGGNDQDANAVAVTLNGLAGTELCLMFDARFAATPPALPPTGGWTNVVTQTDNNSYSSRVSQVEASGATQLCEAQGESYTVLIAVAIGDAAPSAGPPSITDVDEDNTITSTQTDVEIDGEDFDTATVEIRQGSTTVVQSIDSQTDTSIQFDVVFDAGATDLRYGAATLAVINADDQEDTIAITIAPPSGRAYVDLGTPNTTADNRITAVTDLAAGDQLEISNVQGGTIDDVTVNADATFDADAAVTAFDVRAWDASDSTWGSSATQTITSPGVELVGVAIGSASAAASLTQGVPLAGSAGAGASASGSLMHGVPLEGAALSAAIANGTLSLSVSLAGAAFISALAAAQMTHGVPLAGGAVANAQAAALLSLAVSLSGDAIASVAASAQLRGDVALAGDAEAAAQASATLAGTVSLTGAATAGAEGAGTLTFVIALTAQAVANALATGTLTVSVRLGADAVARALAGGELTVLADVQLQGSAQAGATAAAALNVADADFRPITRMQFRLRSRALTFAGRSRSVAFRLN